MVEWGDPEDTSLQKPTKIITIYKATIYENYLKTNRKDLPQLKI